MELTITQPIFLWMFSIIGLLSILMLLTLIIICVQISRIIKLAHSTLVEVDIAIKETNLILHNTSQVIYHTKEKIVNFVNLTASAVGITKLVNSIRENWINNHRTVSSSPNSGH